LVAYHMSTKGMKTSLQQTDEAIKRSEL